MMQILIIAASSVVQVACGTDGSASADNLEEALLVEGRGVEPDLVAGTTTLTQARDALGSAAEEPSTSGNETTLSAGPLHLIFVTPDEGGEPVLQAIRTARIPNPQYPRWEGETSRGIGFLDSEEKVRAAYGQPAAEWHRSFGGRALFYTSGVVFVLEHPSKITGYDGPPPEPTSGHVTEMWITGPFEVLEAPQAVQQGHLVVTTQPRTTLRISPF